MWPIHALKTQRFHTARSATGGMVVSEGYRGLEKGEAGGLADLNDRYDRWLTRNVRKRFRRVVRRVRRYAAGWRLK